MTVYNPRGGNGDSFDKLMTFAPHEIQMVDFMQGHMTRLEIGEESLSQQNLVDATDLECESDFTIMAGEDLARKLWIVID
jgi:hypothetical protein